MWHIQLLFYFKGNFNAQDKIKQNQNLNAKTKTAFKVMSKIT
jgi:hypothetical protein